MQPELESVGKELSPSDSAQLLRSLRRALGLDAAGQFPGSQPVTLMRKHIPDLINRSYYVCEKSDGVRALLYIKTVNSAQHSILFDRRCKGFRVGMTLAGVGDSLFDGEVLHDERPGHPKYVFAIFDVVLYDGAVVTGDSFPERLSRASRFVYENKRFLQINRHVGIKVKQMHKSYGLSEVYRVIIPKLSHENDGLLFTSVDMPYRFGSTPAYLKWKPAELNTIDFRLRRLPGVANCYRLMCIGKNGAETEYDIYWKEEAPEDAQAAAGRKEACSQDADIEGAIGEFGFLPDKETLDPCSLSSFKGRWMLLRLRRDKKLPNHITVVYNIVDSIEENITFEDLERHAAEMRSSWKKREGAGAAAPGAKRPRRGD